MKNYYFAENGGFLGYKISTRLRKIGPKNDLTTIFVALRTDPPIKHGVNARHIQFLF